MKTTRIVLFAFSLVLCLLLAAGPGYGQATMASTTFSSDVGASDSSVTLASRVGISAGTYLFSDREFMAVTVTPPGTTAGIVYVNRAQGSPQTAHASGATVWVGPASYFGNGDPSGACTAALQTVLPMVSVFTGNVWQCSGGVWLKANLPVHTPGSSSESCTPGQTTADANYVYVCTAAGTWKRAALSTF